LASSGSSFAEASSGGEAEPGARAQPSASEIIAVWRGLERQLSVAAPDSAHHLGLEIEIQRQRHDYQRAIASALAQAEQLRAAARSSMLAVSRSAAAREGTRATLRRVRDQSRTKRPVANS